MAKVFEKEKCLFGVMLVLLIMLGELVLHHFNLAAWPAFMVMVFFLLGHSEVKNIPALLAGGLFGIICLVLLLLLTGHLGPIIGLFPTKLLFIAVFVYSIVLLKDTIPVLFNDYAFMFFLVSSVAAGTATPHPYQWMGIEIIAGGLFIAGILGIRRILARLQPSP